VTGKDLEEVAVIEKAMYVSQERFSITRTRARLVVVLHLIKKINGNESPAWRSQSPDGNRAQPVVHADFPTHLPQFLVL
jgi:hypothetical protein